MAYVYPEDRIDDGVVTDPRPLNRTLGHYYGEFNGMLDKDNITRAIIDTTRIVNFSGSQAAAASGMAGPCNQIKSWRASAVMTVALYSPPEYNRVSDVGGAMDTQDSGLVVESSLSYYWDVAIAPAYFELNCVEFYIVVDGVIVDSSCGMSASFRYGTVYLNGYSTVGSGSHTVYLNVRTYDSHYDATAHTSFMTPPLANLYITNRELIVREVRR